MDQGVCVAAEQSDVEAEQVLVLVLVISFTLKTNGKLRFLSGLVLVLNPGPHLNIHSQIKQEPICFLLVLVWGSEHWPYFWSWM